jgi:UDP-N-acetylmuramate dehydrogenase
MSRASSITETDIARLLPDPVASALRRFVPLSGLCTLRVGGYADWLLVADDIDILADTVAVMQNSELPFMVLGEGSNILPADAGARGLVIVNRCRTVDIGALVRADTGVSFMKLAFAALRAGLSGLEWAVGIPGTLGGALVSNAGAYRGNIGPLVRRLEVVESGNRHWVDPAWMRFSYRDSILRQAAESKACVLQAELELHPDNIRAIRSRARDFQRQRIPKQPWIPSAGSFFKNVNDTALANSLPGLPQPLRQAGVVPAAYLSEAAGCKGLRVGGAMVAARHANFLVNTGTATASDVLAAAEIVKARVFEKFNVVLEEEVLRIGDWRTND